jgi:lipocalin
MSKLFVIFLLWSQTSFALETVPELDLISYQGLWHEISRLPNSFQDKNKKTPCQKTTATYDLTSDGLINVTNTCASKNKEGQTVISQAKAVAFKPKSESKNSKLKVNFVPLVKNFDWTRGLFAGDYWVIGLGPKNAGGLYAWSVVVSPDTQTKDLIKYAWILARDPNFAETSDYQMTLQLLQNQKVDIKALVTQ